MQFGEIFGHAPRAIRINAVDNPQDRPSTRSETQFTRMDARSVSISYSDPQQLTALQLYMVVAPAVKYHPKSPLRPPQSLTLGPFHPSFWLHLSPWFLTYTFTWKVAYDGAVKISKKRDQQTRDTGLRNTDAYGVTPLQMHPDSAIDLFPSAKSTRNTGAKPNPCSEGGSNSGGSSRAWQSSLRIDAGDALVSQVEIPRLVAIASRTRENQRHLARVEPNL
jgi:hypothetical protein